ncbi:hypothetical protein OHW52_17015 [Acinetobacter baumannii]|nr:hypothetical protein [Acinetobacter baumannii]
MNSAFAEIQKTVNQMLNMHPPLPSTAAAKTTRQVPPRQTTVAGKGKNSSQQPSSHQRGGAQQQVKDKAPTVQSSAANKTKRSQEIRQSKKSVGLRGCLLSILWTTIQKKDERVYAKLMIIDV